jgi:hypothetical protein
MTIAALTMKKALLHEKTLGNCFFSLLTIQEHDPK